MRTPDASVRARILEAVGPKGWLPRSAGTIAELSGVPIATVHDHLRRLVADGEVVTQPRGKRTVYQRAYDAT